MINVICEFLPEYLPKIDHSHGIIIIYNFEILQTYGKSIFLNCVHYIY